MPDVRQERKKKMREELLKIIEKNSRIDLKELAVILGVEEIDVVNEMAAMEAEGIICGYHTLIDWEKTSIEKVSALIEVRGADLQIPGGACSVPDFRRFRSARNTGGEIPERSFRVRFG